MEQFLIERSIEGVRHDDHCIDYPMPYQKTPVWGGRSPCVLLFLAASGPNERLTFRKPSRLIGCLVGNYAGLLSSAHANLVAEARSPLCSSNSCGASGVSLSEPNPGLSPEVPTQVQYHMRLLKGVNIHTPICTRWNDRRISYRLSFECV